MIPWDTTNQAITIPVTLNKISLMKALFKVNGKRKPKKLKNLVLLQTPSYHFITCQNKWKCLIWQSIKTEDRMIPGWVQMNQKLYSLLKIKATAHLTNHNPAWVSLTRREK